MRLFDLTGRVFGRWTVLGRDPRRGDHEAFWRCRCSCGLVKAVGSTRLRRGLSAGCRACANRTLVDLTGQVFGDWTVLWRARSRHGTTLWTCRCACGHVAAVAAQGLQSGVKSCRACFLRRARKGPKCRTPGCTTIPQGRSKTECWACARRRQRAAKRGA